MILNPAFLIFRGPKGVWTLEKKGLKPDINISWDDAKPTLTHMSLVSLEQHGQYHIGSVNCGKA